MIAIKRVYEPASPEDGYRVLVDRLWPRGISKDRLQVDQWMKEIAPSTDLRRWFGHDPEKWNDFKGRYWKELDNHPELVDQLRDLAQKGNLTLVYSAKDEAHNDAVALREYLER